MKIILDYKKMITDLIIKNYGNKICFLFSGEDEINSFSFYLEEYAPSLYIFDTTDELIKFIEEYKLNIVDGYSQIWINGKEDNSLIYELRG